MRLPVLLLASALALAGCQRNDNGKPTGGSGSSGIATATTGSGSGSAATIPAAPAQDLDSKDILARAETSSSAQVKHVLIGWKDLAAAYGGQMDPRAANRSNAEAATLAQEIAAKLKADPTQIDAQIKEHGEDPGAQSGEPYEVTASARFVPPFKNLALRLKPNEVGIVRTDFGYHVMVRMTPPPPDPLESADILARPGPTTKDSVTVQHVLIGWQDTPVAKARPEMMAEAAKKRTKAEADKIAADVLAKAKGGADFGKLMKQFSEDPGSKENARPYDVNPDTGMVEPFKDLALRLKIDEVGLVKSPFGWHVIKRITPPPPPPPDSLDSVEILKRAPVADKVKVKHILLGWTDAHASDPRGAKRTRAELEKLVKDTLARLAKGEKIETLMTELSEDGGSAKSGEGYDVTPDAGLVPPFKNLSLRLDKDEVGVVKSEFGIHIIKRVE